MNKRVIISLGIILTIFCSGFILNNIIFTDAEESKNEIKFSTYSKNALIAHVPILINSDSDFLTYSFDGDGTFQEPYIIKELSIVNSTSAYGILINNTSSYFIIRNCYIETDAIGISIQNVANKTAIITDNVAFGNDEGAFVLNSANYTIISNNVAELDQVGISITNSFGIYVGNNTITGGTPVGYTCNSGISTSNCENVILINNTIRDYNNGLYSQGSIKMFIENNTILKSKEYGGIYLTEGSNQNHIINNTISNSTAWDGICLTESSKNEIAYNVLKNNKWYGCNLQTDSINNSVHHNIFINNNNDSQQGYAESIDNIWYQTSMNEGNYWSDWNGSGSYALAGVGLDLYPLNVRHYANWSLISSPISNIDDSYEDNDNSISGTTIASNTLYQELIANDLDFYEITLTREDRISIEINFNKDLGNLELYFFGYYFQTFINSTSSTGTVNLICDCTRSGVYYIAVQRKQSSVPFLIYSLTTSLTTQLITDDPYEDNDYFDEAKPIAKDNTHDLVYKDLDYYLFTISMLTLIEVKVGFDSNLIDLDIYLLPNYFNGSMWQVLAFSELNTSPETFIYEAEYTGTYCLLVTTFGDSFTPQSYTLIISTDVTTDSIAVQSLFLTLTALITLVGFTNRLVEKRKVV